MREEILIDARTGILTGRPAVAATGPLELFAARASICDPTVFGGRSVGQLGSGSSPRAELATAAALGEAVERYACALPPHPVRRTSYARLRADGEDALWSSDLARHSSEQYARPGFPFAWTDDDAIISWVAGRRMDDGHRVWVPADTVASSAEAIDGRRLHFPVAAGTACARNTERAAWSALLEAVERHAVATAWYQQTPLGHLQTISRDGLDIATYLVPAPIPVVLALATGRPTSTSRDPVQGVGSAAHPHQRLPAIRKATAEAVQAWQSMSALDDPAEVELARLTRPQGPLVPWREDRRYLDSYREDLADVVDLWCHAQLGLDPRVIRATSAMLNGPVASSEQDPGIDPLQRIAAAFGTPILVDITPSDVATTGLCVVRCVLPHARPVAPAAFAFLDGLAPAPPEPLSLLIPFA